MTRSPDDYEHDLTRVPTPDRNDHEEAVEQAEFNDAITCAFGLITKCLAKVRIQAHGHPGDWSETLDYLTTAAETLPRMR